jgi:hypothetical protein
MAEQGIEHRHERYGDSVKVGRKGGWTVEFGSVLGAAVLVVAAMALTVALLAIVY